MADIPAVTELTPDWLTGCLAAAGHPDVRVTGLRIERIGTGQAAACARLFLELAGDAPAAPSTLIAKFPPDDAATRRSCVAMGIYRREVEFYRDVAPRLTMSLPRCYFLGVDAAGDRFLILMEDLLPAVAGDQLAGCTPDVARAAVLELVGLQAPTWCDKALGRRFLEPEDGFFSDMHGLYNRMLPAFTERFAARLEQDEMDIIAAVGASPGAPLFQPVGTPFCLEHRDYRLDNLMIDQTRRPPRVVVVDWQGMRTGRPLNDVALCLAGGLEPAQRRSVEADIVRDYHTALLAAGVTGFPFEQCWNEYRRAAFAGLGLTVVAAVAVAATERGDRMFTAMARRYARHALDLDAREFLT